MVDSEMPVARLTATIPPCPGERASVAAQRRRERSFNTGRETFEFARNQADNFNSNHAALTPSIRMMRG